MRTLETVGLNDDGLGRAASRASATTTSASTATTGCPTTTAPASAAITKASSAASAESPTASAESAATTSVSTKPATSTAATASCWEVRAHVSEVCELKCDQMRVGLWHVLARGTKTRCERFGYEGDRCGGPAVHVHQRQGKRRTL